jgi:uncharacterized protein DUF262/uncharacterized protein DUF1524
VQANPKTVDKLFAAQSRYVVPMFQRLYVWAEDPQWRTLWEDVVEKAELRLEGVETNAHYLGALIIEGVKPLSANEVTRLLLIDGQQRITTLQILLCAFRDCARAQGLVGLERRATRYIENPDADVMDKPDEEVFKVWPTQLNRDIFSAIIQAGSKDLVEEKYPLVRRKYQRKHDPRSPLVECYLYFYSNIFEWIVDGGSDEADREKRAAFLLSAVQQDLCVVEIALSDGDDSQEIFYSLNSQGRPLSQSDLLRSLIFMRAEKEREDRDKLFEDYWGQFETPFWSYDVKRGGRTYSRLDIAVRHFLAAKTGALVDTRRVNEEYKRWIASSPPPYLSVREELSDLTKFAAVFKNFEADFADQQSTHFGRVLRDLDVSTAMPLTMFLMLEAGLGQAQLQRCLAVLESFLVRRTFNGDETKEYNKLFVEIIGVLRGLQPGGVYDGLVSKLLAGRGTTRAWPTDEQITERALGAPVYSYMRQAPLRLILERCELQLRGKKTEGEGVQLGLQIEHILPLRWWEHWPINGKSVGWYEASYPHTLTDTDPELEEAIRQRNTLLHTIGNLTLLNEYLNPAASNGAFPLKKTEYTHSVLRLNRYYDGKLSWSENDIQDRSKVLAKIICLIWPRPEAP